MTEADTSTVRLPVLWVSSAALAIAIAAFVTCFALNGLVICACPLIGLLFAGLAFRAAMWQRDQSAHRAPVPVAKRMWFAFAAGGVFAAHVGLGLSALSATRMAAKAPVAAANLRGLGQALAMYHKQFGDYPPTLFVLVTAGLSSRKMLLTPFDPVGSGALPNRPQTYTSFEYSPGVGAWQAEPHIILAYERANFCQPRASLFPIAGRYVLFGDCAVRWLEESKFEVAMRADAERRSALAWPSVSGQPASQPAE